MILPAPLLLALALAADPPAEPCRGYARAVPGAPAPAGGAPGCLAALEEACEAGGPRACDALAAALEAGAGGAPDPDRAARLHARACAAGLGEACAAVARERETAGDQARAAAAREEGCALGAASACAALAAAAPPERAPALRERACDLGDAPTCLALGREDAGRDPVGALAHAEAACRLGEGEGCALAAELVPAAGRIPARPGGARPPRRPASTPRRLLERGCALEAPLACARLGVELAAAGGPDAARGRTLLAAHCEALGPDRCLDAAAAYLADQGGPEAVLGERSDPALLEAACGRGVLSACARLGRLAQEGVRAPADGRRAATLYQQACDGGVAQACADLGVLHRFGAGVAADEARARALLDRACLLGLAQGCFLRDDPVRLAGPAAGDR